MSSPEKQYVLDFDSTITLRKQRYDPMVFFMLVSFLLHSIILIVSIYQPYTPCSLPGSSVSETIAPRLNTLFVMPQAPCIPTQLHQQQPIIQSQTFSISPDVSTDVEQDQSAMTTPQEPVEQPSFQQAGVINEAPNDQSPPSTPPRLNTPHAPTLIPTTPASTSLPVNNPVSHRTTSPQSFHPIPRSHTDEETQHALQAVKRRFPKLLRTSATTPQASSTDQSNNIVAKTAQFLNQTIQNQQEKQKPTLLHRLAQECENQAFFSYAFKVFDELKRTWSRHYEYQNNRFFQTGKLIVDFGINQDGSLHHAKVIHSTCNKSVNEAVEHVFRLAAPFPPIPKHLGISRWTDQKEITVHAGALFVRSK